MGTTDFGLQPPHRLALVWAGVIWGVLGVVRLIWVSAWIIGRWRSAAKKIRLSGRRLAMQTDISAMMGRWRPQHIRDNTGRPRFCRLHDACFDSSRPLADRVYHCTYVAEKCKRDQQLRGIHIPVYDHYCSWIGIIVSLDTMKAYLLVLIFLAVDALSVLACSLAGLILFPQSVLYTAVMVLSAFIVLGLGVHNAWMQMRHLALNNTTYPERQYLKRSRAFYFRIYLARDSNVFDDFRFVGTNPNPWDLGTRRNLHQVFGGWDCLLPWTQPPRSADYGNPKYDFDFEMSDEFRVWVEEKREVLRTRAAGSQPAVASSDQREEAQSRGSPPAPQQPTPFPSPPLILPSSPQQLPRLSPSQDESSALS